MRASRDAGTHPRDAGIHPSDAGTHPRDAGIASARCGHPSARCGHPSARCGHPSERCGHPSERSGLPPPTWAHPSLRPTPLSDANAPPSARCVHRPLASPRGTVRCRPCLPRGSSRSRATPSSSSTSSCGSPCPSGRATSTSSRSTTSCSVRLRVDGTLVDVQPIALRDRAERRLAREGARAHGHRRAAPAAGRADRPRASTAQARAPARVDVPGVARREDGAPDPVGPAAHPVRELGMEPAAQAHDARRASGGRRASSSRAARRARARRRRSTRSCSSSTPRR